MSNFIEFLKIVNTFSYANVLHRNIQFRLDGNCNTSLGSSVQLGKDNTADICDLRKLSRLCKGILSGGTIQHYQCLQICIRILPLQDPVNLAEFFHKVLFIMKTSCCIAEKYVCISCFGCSHRIIDNRCRICSRLSADDLHTCTVRPLSKLLSCCCAESIGCCKDNLLALVF